MLSLAVVFCVFGSFIIPANSLTAGCLHLSYLWVDNIFVNEAKFGLIIETHKFF